MRAQLRIATALAVVIAWASPIRLDAVRAQDADLVDVNRASMQELMHLPGLTEVWARRIVRFRPYHTKLDLMNQGVVTPEVYARIRDRIVAHRMAHAD